MDESGSPLRDPNQPWFALAGVDIAAANVPALNRHVRDVCADHLGEQASATDFELKGGKLLSPNPKREQYNLKLADRVKFACDLLDVPSGTRLYASAVDTRLWPLREPPPLFDWGRYCRELALERPDFFLLLEMIGDFCFALDHDGSSGIEGIAFGQRDGVIDRGHVIVDARGSDGWFIPTMAEELRKHRPLGEGISVCLADERLDGDPLPQDSRNHEAIWIADVLAALVRHRHQDDGLSGPVARLYDSARFRFQGHRFVPREWMSEEHEQLLRRLDESR